MYNPSGHFFSVDPNQDGNQLQCQKYFILFFSDGQLKFMSTWKTWKIPIATFGETICGSPPSTSVDNQSTISKYREIIDTLKFKIVT